MSDRIGHPGHDTSHVASVPGFETKTLPAPSFNTPSPPAPAPPVDRRDSSSGVRQSEVDSMIAAARAKGDANYLAKLIEAARNDGWSVPDQPGQIERIVKAPQDAASYQSPGDGSHWGLKQ